VQGRRISKVLIKRREPQEVEAEQAGG
jgi:hypothetical protein